MKLSVIQMNMRLGEPEYNFTHAVGLIRRAAVDRPDVILLPETWNVGFFPAERLAELADRESRRVKETLAPLAAELGINLVAGSVANLRGKRVYNTCCVFDRAGDLVAEYDKTHLFTPMGEDKAFAHGERLETFSLDGVRCGVAICYDIRFPELVRSLALKEIDLLFVAAQWPSARVWHWQTLNTARAIENQIFVAAANSCARAGDIQYAGHSMLIDPWGEVLAQGGTGEEIITAVLDLNAARAARAGIRVYRDRRPSLYELG